ncbi:zinc knuckle CX2CX4HX4C containing protein [Tanacetum coccineum]
MVVPNLEGAGYTKETIRVEYEWKPSRCSTCFIFGHSLDDCPKVLKRVVNKMDKGNGGLSGADDESFVEVKKKKSCGKNGGNKKFKLVFVKLKPQCRPKAKQSTGGVNQKTTPSVVRKLKRLLNGNYVLVDDDDDGKPLKNFDYSREHDSEDEIKSIDNEMASYLASKLSGVGYGTKSLLEQ